jgi:hypothetical protein
MMRTYIDTYQTPRARIRVHDKDSIFKTDRIFRAVVGAHAALITEVDAVIAGRRKACFNAQQ